MSSLEVDAEQFASRLISNLATTWTTDEMGGRSMRDEWHHARRVLLANLLDTDDIDKLIVEARHEIADLTERVDRIIDARTGQ